MSKTVTINVTRKMIREARDLVKAESFTTHCPIALALRAAGYTRVSVGVSTFSIPQGSHPLSLSAMEFVRDFDKFKPVKPARFRLTINE